MGPRPIDRHPLFFLSKRHSSNGFWFVPTFISKAVPTTEGSHPWILAVALTFSSDGTGERVSCLMSKSPLCCDHACQVSRAEKKKSPRPLEQRCSARVHARTLQIRSKCTNTCCLWSSNIQPIARTPFSRNESGYLVDQLEDVVRNEEAAGGVLHQVEGLREVHGVLTVVDLCGRRE